MKQFLFHPYKRVTLLVLKIVFWKFHIYTSFLPEYAALSSCKISKVLDQYIYTSLIGLFWTEVLENWLIIPAGISWGSFTYFTFVCLWYPTIMLHINLISMPPPIVRPNCLVKYISRVFLKNKSYLF